MINIIIADDQLLFRTMLKEMLLKDSEFYISALVSNGLEAITECKKHQPDVILLDIGMPIKDGIETLKEIKKVLPEIKVIMLTTFEDKENIKCAIQLGADGYLIKEMTPETLILSIKNIKNGMIVFHNSVYEILQSMVSSSQNGREQKKEIGNFTFDPVEINIMKLIAKGKSNKDIATSLNYSEGTIKNKVSHILSVTGLSDRTEISVFAINNDII